MKKLLQILVLSLGLISLVYADSENFSFKTGGTVINVKTPSGFFESSYIDPEIEEIVKMMYPKESYNVHSVLVPHNYNFNDQGDRYIILATLVEMDGIKISKSDFKYLKDIIRDEQFTIMNEVQGDANEMIKNQLSEVNSEWGTNMKMSINEMTPLGVFIDTKEAISFDTIMAGDYSESGNEEGLLMLNSTSFIHIKNSLIITYVYSNFNSPADIVWIEAKTKELIELMLKNN